MNIFLNFLNVHLFLRERQRQRQSTSGGGAERGRHRIQSGSQALSCQHRARPRAWTHEQWDHDLSRSRMLNRLSHPGTLYFNNVLLVCPLILSMQKKVWIEHIGLPFLTLFPYTTLFRSKQDPGSELSAQSPMRGWNLWAARWWPELKSDT